MSENINREVVALAKKIVAANRLVKAAQKIKFTQRSSHAVSEALKVLEINSYTVRICKNCSKSYNDHYYLYDLSPEMLCNDNFNFDDIDSAKKFCLDEKATNWLFAYLAMYGIQIREAKSPSASSSPSPSTSESPSASPSPSQSLSRSMNSSVSRITANKILVKAISGLRPTAVTYNDWNNSIWEIIGKLSIKNRKKKNKNRKKKK